MARLAGVSVKSVSNYFNGYPYMREETRARIEAAVAELGYRMNVSARSLRSRRTGMIALVVPELDQPYFAELAQNVATAAAEHGLGVFTEITRGLRDRELDVLSGSRCRMVDGMIFCPLALGADDVGHLVVDFPLILIGERIFDSPVQHVTMPNVAASRAAVEHLLARGRRRILALGAGDSLHPSASALRTAGYRQALAAAGIEPDPELLVLPDGLWHRAAGSAAVSAALERGVRFDAVFGFNDALALGALHALHVNGLAVPRDVAVVGFDNTEDGRYAVPPLTSVDPGREQIARTAVELLTRELAGADDDTQPGRVSRGSQATLTDFRLIVRASSG